VEKKAGVEGGERGWDGGYSSACTTFEGVTKDRKRPPFCPPSFVRVFGVGWVMGFGEFGARFEGRI
jgi:hypothetical protein